MVRKDGESSRDSQANNGCVVWMYMGDTLRSDSPLIQSN